MRGASRNVRVSERVEDIGKRTRYYQSMIDIDSLLKGAVYSELKESCVIFICTNDPELRDFLSFVKNNTAESEHYRQNFTKAYS